MFTPLEGLAGGSIIGVAAASLLLLNGQILGASGIVSSTILAPKAAIEDSSRHWKLALLAGFLASTSFFFQYFVDVPPPTLYLSPLRYAIGGLFVGFGTKLGNGCTSGHGICGLARFSKRSFAAVLAFMATGSLTAVFSGPSVVSELAPKSIEAWTGTGRVLALFAVIAAIWAVRTKPSHSLEYYKSFASAALSGSLFSAGLLVSGMIYPVKVGGFLDVTGMADGTWDPTLAMVMGGGLVVSLLSYLYRSHRSQPVCGTDFHVPTNTVIDLDLLVGASCFGIGWGTALLCPGPALFHAALGTPSVLGLWWPTYVIGAYSATVYKDLRSQQGGKDKTS